MGNLKNRARLVQELEKDLGKRVFAIIYNPSYHEGIKEGDQKYIYDFLENVIGEGQIEEECIFIFSGFGGNLKTAILCSEMIRKKLKKYSIFIPTVACSSICYFVLQADQLLIGKKSILTQIDPMFDYEGDSLRAIKNLNHSDPRISYLSKKFFNPVFENIKRVIQNPPHVFESEVSKRSLKKTDYLIKLIDSWMGKDYHESEISFRELKRLKVHFKVLDESIIEKAKVLIKECMRELDGEDQRFVIQTNNIYDRKYFGGIFYS